ncbi:MULTISPECIES: iron-containing alcohol dehydrogenase [Alteromonadaceae]|uniref:iron-containing alcohol dehydrogenase n=1 Tax=Alteromonadaceae TaxID=72275 RepID=UPI001C087657|nr:MULTISPECIES: iron-containing alcohol dehydrogenase [Aliiglaciecola]MBU2879051.1 iron-containing alcohol dehydrogenase [Aliiglaciecola lipolytica]MDO6710749.1 iron-containing alcohol dehydrogenase [Aliiglaciecola sp. 2_MG-2023]MDO6751843.1 iron-containing alcohol dehydrogenase [Aliiglaciecola sp. 1_MG-2023]
MTSTVEFITANKIICNIGAIEQIAEHCRALGIKQPLIVTDPGLVKAGLVTHITAPLNKAGITAVIYSDIQADPPESLVLSAAEFAKQLHVDGVIGFGGGSSLDVAKLLAVLVNSKQPLKDMYGLDKIRDKRLPLILLPTTAGTGSEVTPISIITTGETTKSGVVSPSLLPDIAILDATLTVGLPPAITAATGIDAMVHAIEAFTGKIKKNPYSDMLAKEALRLMSQNLLEAVNNGSNLEARSNMLLGALMAGQAFANSPVAAVHALAYPLGGNYHIPHGLSNSLVLPHVLRFNAPVAADLYAELLPSVTSGQNHQTGQKGCDAFINVIDNLITDVSLPKSLQALNVPREDLGMLADEAMQQQRLLVNNPREVTRENALDIYESAY